MKQTIEQLTEQQSIEGYLQTLRRLDGFPNSTWIIEKAFKQGFQLIKKFGKGLILFGFGQRTYLHEDPEKELELMSSYSRFINPCMVINCNYKNEKFHFKLTKSYF